MPVAKGKAAVRMAVTMGDASGVGPEIVLRRYAAGQIADDVVVYGDADILAAGARLLQVDVPVAAIKEPSGASAGRLNVVDLKALSAADFTPGRLSAKAGSAAREYVSRATNDALSGAVAGIVTMPMNKEATQLSTPGFVGHTEFIAGLCGNPDVSMMLTTKDVAVAHVSAHVSLVEAIRRVTPSRLATVIRLTDQAVRRLRSAPRIAVCGLNPHAGENGLLGREDVEIIAPVIAAERARGLDVSGPHPCGHGVLPSHPQGPFRCDCLHVPRSGPCADEAGRFRVRSECDHRIADRAHLGGPRDGV